VVYQYPPATLGPQEPGAALGPGPGPGPVQREGRIGPLRVAAITVLTSIGLILLSGAIRLTWTASTSSQPNAAARTSQAQLEAASDQWETVPVTSIFPASVTAAVSGIAWNRVGISPPASCQTALTTSFAPNSGAPCQTVLRATYVDQARTIAATVAIVIVPQTGSMPADAEADWQEPFEEAATQISDTGNSRNPPQFPVNVTPVPRTAAAYWTDAGLIGIGASILAGGESQWMALVVETGSLDGRGAGNLPAPWAGESGGAARDQDGWEYPALNLSQTFSRHCDSLFG
jgi:hypothetical protein